MNLKFRRLLRGKLDHNVRAKTIDVQGMGCNGCLSDVVGKLLSSLGLAEGQRFPLIYVPCTCLVMYYSSRGSRVIRQV